MVCGVWCVFFRAREKQQKQKKQKKNRRRELSTKVPLRGCSGHFFLKFARAPKIESDKKNTKRTEGTNCRQKCLSEAVRATFFQNSRARRKNSKVVTRARASSRARASAKKFLAPACLRLAGRLGGRARARTQTHTDTHRRAPRGTRANRDSLSPCLPAPRCAPRWAGARAQQNTKTKQFPLRLSFWPSFP